MHRWPRAAMNRLTRAARGVSEAAQRICGEPRILAPMSFGTRWLSPLIAASDKANPRLRLSLELDDRLVDLSCDGYDVAPSGQPHVGAEGGETLWRGAAARLERYKYPDSCQRLRPIA